MRFIKSAILGIVSLFICMVNAHANKSHAPCQEKAILAYDAYLGIPSKDTQWQSFMTKHCVQLKPYRDIDKLVVDLQHHQITGAFIPAGAYYYLRNDSFYQGIASATLGLNKDTNETAYLLVKKNSGTNSLQQLAQKKWAYINHECTTSYFAPMIYLKKHHQDPSKIFKQLMPVKGFQAQVDTMLHEKEVDVMMLWQPYWNKNPLLSKKAKIVGTLNDLPTPVFILSKQSNQTFKNSLTSFLAHYYTSQPSWFYSGFRHYCSKQNQKFWADITEATHHTAPLLSQAPESISIHQLQNFEKNPPKVKTLISLALELSEQKLAYQYGSANPLNGGMDCSGTIYYLLNKIGISDVPRSANLQYQWLLEKGHLHTVQGQTLNAIEFTSLKPGDLLFWNGTYAIQRQPNVTHVMIYLGKNQKGEPLMAGASNGRTYKGRKIYGVSVFDFQLPDPGAKSQFLGYGCIPKVNC